MIHYIVKKYPAPLGERSLGHYSYRKNAEKVAAMMRESGDTVRIIEAEHLLRPAEMRRAIEETAA